MANVQTKLDELNKVYFERKEETTPKNKKQMEELFEWFNKENVQLGLHITTGYYVK